MTERRDIEMGFEFVARNLENKLFEIFVVQRSEPYFTSRLFQSGWNLKQNVRHQRSMEQAFRRIYYPYWMYLVAPFIDFCSSKKSASCLIVAPSVRQITIVCFNLTLVRNLIFHMALTLRQEQGCVELE